MSFRKIRPSFGDSSASTSNPSQSTSESTGSDPRRLRGEKETLGAESSASSSKRRRVPESVTRNACLNCKKARAKCDGKKPCKRCALRVETSECIYEIHIKHAKEELVKQIKELRAKDHLTDQILQALSTDEKVPDILQRLKKGETYESIVECLGRTPMSDDFEALSPRESQLSGIETQGDVEMAGSAAGNFRWTTVTSDMGILDHLFQLYFAWVHPVHTLFSEGLFVDSYKRQSDNFCSSILVNAICALACHLHSGTETEEPDFEQMGAEFSDAVRDGIDADDQSITTIQAFAVMFLVDCGRANALRASSYLRMAHDNLVVATKRTGGGGYDEVWRNTVRGVRNLSIEWALVTFQIPPRMEDMAYDLVDPNDDQLDEAKWYFYRYPNDQCPAWAGLLATTNREKSKLAAIIQDMVVMLYSQQGPKIRAHDILDQYRRFVQWREALPTAIGSIESNNSQALPHVLSLLILYQAAVVQLLRPLLDLERFPSSSVEEVIWNHAQQGLFLLHAHYRTQYTCQYQPALQMFSVLQLTDIIARFFPGGIEVGSKDGPEAVQFGMEALAQSRIVFPVAGPLQEMLRKTTVACGIRLPRSVMDLMNDPAQPNKVYRMDDLIDACTRPTYIQPIAEIHARYNPSIGVDWLAAGPEYGFVEPLSGSRRLRVPSAEERGAQSLMQIRNLLNG